MEKEVYDAMIQTRSRIDNIAGPSKGLPELPDLPVGKPPVAGARHMSEASGAGIPADVLAAGDPTRNADAKVAPFIPASTASSSSYDPFPQLGAQGRPLS